ncbi:hydroxyacylglutathione hydrolase [Amphibacillus sp. MSJ-3]|uniref:hydroxyacylglutathione hydrolase n=1 Tax=Amphibacillus sp. MSJ-3 TaxID=2841505 RepID=UPI001C0EC654|nr:hydroxyacylglutathione hydrolase [Amphibacillus sp. MSJ-3]MBU5594307.1 hydroxyacylglutathione hydrolase [Amphibacillus sp. MSJ-3]
MKIHPIKAFSDNYIWVIEKDSIAVVVDPGQASAVIAYLEAEALELGAIFLTHNHHDHTDGVEQILALHPGTPVYGPQETVPLNDHILDEGDTFELFEKPVSVLKTPGHTDGHISYLVGDALFCGDALFSAGTGRVFTGDYQAHYDSLQKFKHLKDTVKVYAGHEYTETNLRFAKSIDPKNRKITEALAEVTALRKEDKSTLPSTIGREKEINLFLQAESLEDFIKRRQARDHF